MRGSYGAETGLVTMVTTHFSKYAVVYNPVYFSNVKNEWFANLVMFAAARGITNGVDNDKFASSAVVTRGQFITMLLRVFQIEPLSGDSFSDAGSNWYSGYLAAAKQMGISNGVGGNLFAPDREITREEMFRPTMH